MGRTGRAIGKIMGVSAEPGRMYQAPAKALDPNEIGARLARAAPSAIREPVEIAPPTLRRTATHIAPNAFWNGIARAWFVEVDGEVVRLDPQPPAPGVGGVPVSPRIDL